MNEYYYNDYYNGLMHVYRYCNHIKIINNQSEAIYSKISAPNIMCSCSNTMHTSVVAYIAL